MKEFIDKLISRLEEEANKEDKKCSEALENGFNDTVIKYNHGQFCYINTISIINQLAEEYKVSEMPTGWKENIMERFEKVE